MVWYYIVGSGAALYGLFGLYKSICWMWASISRRINQDVTTAISSPSNSDARVDIDSMTAHSPTTLRHVKRTPSFNRAFSCPATPKMSRLFELKDKR